jgi:hypothetical protein
MPAEVAEQMNEEMRGADVKFSFFCLTIAR